MESSGQLQGASHREEEPTNPKNQEGMVFPTIANGCDVSRFVITGFQM